MIRMRYVHLVHVACTSAQMTCASGSTDIAGHHGSDVFGWADRPVHWRAVLHGVLCSGCWEVFLVHAVLLPKLPILHLFRNVCSLSLPQLHHLPNVSASCM